MTLLDPVADGGNADAMRRLASLTDDVAKAIRPGASIGYLDYPLHINVGDLLIFQGCMDFFATNGNVIPVSFSIRDARENAWAALEQVEVIVCHGGGNFGDIYRPHQLLREEAIRRFPHKPIVALPQSIHFGSTEAMKESAAHFARHDNVTIFVRDQPSHDVARHHFSDRVVLMPDMAHRLYDGWAPIRAGQTQHLGTLALMRREVEAVQAQSDQPASVDWRDLLPTRDKLAVGRHRLLAELRSRLNSPADSPAAAYAATVDAATRRLAGRLVSYDHWVTSRLHGAIMGNLLGKRISAHDNSYGKVAKYFAQWGPELIARP